MFGWIGSFFGAQALAGVLQAAINFCSNLLTFLGPVLGKSLELGSWALSTVWEGLKDIFDNAATILTVAAIVVGTWFYVKVPAEIKVLKCQAEMRTITKTVQSKCPPPKVIYKTRPAPQPEFKFPWE